MSKKTIKKRPWNYGKRKPREDEDGTKWCACLYPKLASTMGIGGGQAHCLKCHTNWYH